MLSNSNLARDQISPRIRLTSDNHLKKLNQWNILFDDKEQTFDFQVQKISFKAADNSSNSN